MSKLEAHGIDISWFSSYIRDHTQSVNFSDCEGNILHSKPVPNDGVFQESALAPLLYNDLSLFSEDAVVIQYADDTQILVSGRKADFDKVIRKLEPILESVGSWFCAKGLEVNAEKLS